MKLIEQSSELITSSNGIQQMKYIQLAGRTCYDSYDKITDDSYKRFIKMLIKHGHQAPIEFGDMMFKIQTSRAVLAQITRHRLMSFCVRSQRYVNENSQEGISFVRPEWFNERIGQDYTDPQGAKQNRFLLHLLMCENEYNLLRNNGTNQQARQVLPNCTATTIYAKANMREWRHFFNLRCDVAAYPQMRSLALQMLKQAYQYAPEVFEDLYQKFIKPEE